MELINTDELRHFINEFDVIKFFEGSSDFNVSKGATGIITSRQIILLENTNNGTSLHEDMLKNIYYDIYPKIRKLVDLDNESIDKWSKILSRENITIKFANETNKIVIVEFPLLDGITYDEYKLFEHFLQMYYNILMDCCDAFYVKIGMDFYALKDDLEVNTTYDEILSVAQEYVNSNKTTMNLETVIGMPRLLSANEISVENDNFDLTKFMEVDTVEDEPFCAVGVITDKQMILMNNLHDGHGFHDEAIGNIYYEINDEVKERVNNSEFMFNSIMSARENIIKDRDITMRFVNNNKVGLLQIYIPEYLTINMYDLFKKFLGSNHYLFKEMENYCICTNDFVYEYDNKLGVFVNMEDKSDKYSIMELFTYLNTLVIDEERLDEAILGTILESRKL